MAFENRQPYFKRIFAGKNIYIFALVAIAFAALNIYRLNNPLETGMDAPELTLYAYNGESFTMNEILSPKVVIFYKKHTFFSNYVINTTYRRALSDTVEELNNLLGEEDYKNYKNIMFAADTKKAGKDYGIRSWPHLYVISSDNRVIYETKIGSADKVQQILWRD